MSSHPGSPELSPRKGKYLACQVHFLDDTVHIFHIPQKCLGRALFDEVINKLQLLEADYFDLEYRDTTGIAYWLDHEKPILKQIGIHALQFLFLIKFYTPDPGLLEEEYTRYLFALQVKRDLATGSMPCQEHTAVLLASYIVQAEIGDFLEEEYVDHTYLSHLRLLPNQTPDLDVKIMEHHREHVGQTPAEADFNLLDTSRKVEFYGMRLHPSKDHEAVSLHLAVAHMGVLVFQNYTKINTFSWAKIRKLSFKRKKFLIKLHPEGYGYYKDTVEFYFDTRDECKNFWKKCIEHHAFFRCHHVKRLARNKTRIRSRGSSFRYSGKTQKQLVEYVRDNFVKRPPFERSTSMRTVSTSPRSTGATPKSGTLNSRDLHFTRSVSHDLKESHSCHLVERAEIHDDSSQSGSRSLGSPKMDRTLGTTPQAPPSYAEVNHEGPPPLYHDHRPPPVHQLDPSQFMLSKDSRKFSAPAFPGYGENGDVARFDEHNLPRSPELPNIPDSVLVHPREEQPRPSSIHRTATSPTSVQIPVVPNHIPHSNHVMVRQDSQDDDEPLPPPPPPIFQGETPRERERSKERRLDRSKLSQIEDEDRPADLTLLSKSTSAASATLTSNMSVTSSQADESEDEGRRKKYSVNKAYYIAKELLMTERTYKKDLEVITVWFRNSLCREDRLPDNLADILLPHLDTIYDFHCRFLRDLEQRLVLWEGKSASQQNGADHKCIGDIMLSHTQVLQVYQAYMEQHEEILSELELELLRNKSFDAAFREFESQKVCYLPFHTFLLKPAQRLLHYRLVLQRLLKHYGPRHVDYEDCEAALSNVQDILEPYKEKLAHLENTQKMLELERDLTGIDNLVIPHRVFIREGCLQKLSRKGYQQRMFFLFSDMLVYTSRTATPSMQFKVHGQLPLRAMVVEETDPQLSIPHSFTVYGGNRCLLLAASSELEKSKWLEDLQTAVSAARSHEDDDDEDIKLRYSSLRSNSSSEALEDSVEDGKPPHSPERQMQHRANTTMHVCWHRNTSVSMRDMAVAVESQLSGYLLRKFKNSNGWQKLWVVFTNFCLFFYKTFQDDFPLASLPLLGYSVSAPSEEDGINKDFVFKLQFKNHVYFFRAESEYTFHRWIDVVSGTTSASRRTRLFSRLDSADAL